MDSHIHTRRQSRSLSYFHSSKTISHHNSNMILIQTFLPIPLGVVLPYTILDEQRRMRTSIADLTRPDYSDVVQILDHASTAQQCITPYKGQKTAITNSLRKNGSILPFRKESPPPRGTTVSVSTVDRYQGDENDVVILSLVRCSPGNRFVGLHNRFVVGVSRARLGFFISKSRYLFLYSQSPICRRFV